MNTDEFAVTQSPAAELKVQSQFKLSQLAILATDRSSCYLSYPLYAYGSYSLSPFQSPYTTVQMLSLDDCEVVADTLDSASSVDSFQFLIGTVNRNSEMKMFSFSCE